VIAAESNGVALWVPLVFGLVGTIVGAGATILGEVVRTRSARSQAKGDVQRQWILDLQDAIESLRMKTAEDNQQDPGAKDGHRALVTGTLNNRVLMLAARVSDAEVQRLARAVSDKAWEVRRTAIMEEDTGPVFADLHELIRSFHESVGRALNR
jgi:hypothetical protein